MNDALVRLQSWFRTLSGRIDSIQKQLATLEARMLKLEGRPRTWQSTPKSPRWESTDQL